MKHLIILFLALSLSVSAFACGTCGCSDSKKDNSEKASQSCCASKVKEAPVSSCSSSDSSCDDSSGKSSCSD